jgi:RimJ/RimL family protein N-acetyltransferase
MIIRRLTLEDAGELAAVLVENRGFLASSSPITDERFFTAAGQRERIANDGSERFVILDGGRIAGTVTMSNIVLGPLHSATLGYWVAERVNGRGLATRAVREVIGIAFEGSAYIDSRLRRSWTTLRRSACSRRTASSGSALLAATSKSPASGVTISSFNEPPIEPTSPAAVRPAAARRVSRR